MDFPRFCTKFIFIYAKKRRTSTVTKKESDLIFTVSTQTNWKWYSTTVLSDCRIYPKHIESIVPRSIFLTICIIYPPFHQSEYVFVFIIFFLLKHECHLQNGIFILESFYLSTPTYLFHYQDIRKENACYLWIWLPVANTHCYHLWNAISWSKKWVLYFNRALRQWLLSWKSITETHITQMLFPHYPNNYL